MIRLILALSLAFFVCVLVAAGGSNNSLSKREIGEGWQLLFDGKTLSGWDARETFTPGATGDWTVRNGAIVCPGTTAGWLATTAEFSNFHLKLEFRGNALVNSGVFLRSKKEGQPHITGYELQIWDFQPAGYNTGSLVGTIKAPPVKIRPNHWNQYDITADGDHYLVILNGAKILDTRQSDHQSGVIGLQCQATYKIEYRNLRIHR